TVVTASESTGEQVLLDGEMAETMAALHYLDEATPDRLGRREPVNVLTSEFDAALGDVAPFRAEQIGAGLEGRCLAGAVGSEEGDHVPLGTRHRHAAKHQDNVIVDHLDVVNHKQRRCGHRGALEPARNVINRSLWNSRAG